jgi:hypothetical protein
MPLLPTREVAVMNSQTNTSDAPSASRPRNPRVPPRRRLEARQDLGATSRWKVQLELAPAEIALVYRQGLARGAEVCRRGTQEWRPLVTTPELRPALSARSTLRSLNDATRSTLPPAPTVTMTRTTQTTRTQTVRISDPSLAALVLTRRPSSPPAAIVPRPPAVIARPLAPEPSPFAAAFASAVVPELTPAQLLPGPAPFLLPAPARGKALGFTRLVQHARPAELTLAAVVAALLTLYMTLLALRPWRSHAEPATHAEQSAVRLALPGSDSVPASRPLDFGPGANIPVVTVHDLPVEGHGAPSAPGASGAPASSPAGASASGVSASFAAAAGTSEGVDAGALGRAMTLAGRVAKSCGPGPVSAQIVATFAPSGSMRSVHFGAGAPPVELRSCVLRAMSRARVKPFQGGPVTVSKTLRW